MKNITKNLPMVWATFVLAAYGVLLFFPKKSWSIEWCYGYQYISNLSIWAQVFLMALGFLFVPKICDMALTAVAAMSQRVSGISRWFGVGLAGVLFWVLRSKTIYGDGYGTIHNLTQGERFNWKEPLDRFFTASVFQIGAPFGLIPLDAIALVSIAAGLVWVGLVFRLIRGECVEPVDQFLSAGILLTPGIMQLFFGNVENYSLLAAGVLAYLVESLRYLRGKSHYTVPCFILGFVSCVHLSAAWLLPTLAVLLLNGPGGKRYTLRGKFKNIAQGVGALLMPFIFTLALGVHFTGSAHDLNFRTFGGGDGKCWKPLFATEGPFEKFALFSTAHAVALSNHLLLISAVAFLLIPFLVIAAVKEKQWLSRQNQFLASCLFFSLSYIVLFNPDMAGGRPGILNEWDLFSLPAIPALVWMNHLLFSTTAAPVRNRLALQAIALSFVSTLGWILWNAQKLI